MNSYSDSSKIVVALSFFITTILLLQLIAFLNSSKLNYGKNKLICSIVSIMFWTFIEVIKFSTNNAEVYEFFLSLTFSLVVSVCVFISTGLYELNVQKLVKLRYLFLASIPIFTTLACTLVPELNHHIIVYKGNDLNPFLPSSYQYSNYFYFIEFLIYLSGLFVLKNYYNLESNNEERFRKNFSVITFLVVLGIIINSLILRFDFGITTVIIPFMYAIAFLLMYIGDSYFINNIVKNMLMTKISNSENLFIIVYDSNCNILYANDTFVITCTIAIMEDLVGINIYDLDSLLKYMDEKVYYSVFEKNDSEKHEIKGKIYKKDYKTVSGYKDNELITILTFTDITYETEYSNKLTDLTNIDALTKVKNRFAFQNDFSLLNDDEVKELTCISIDLDNLKITNDVFGHNYGDQIIIKLAEYLKQNFNNANIYRIGGDEFIVLNIGSFENIKKLIDNLFYKTQAYNNLHGLKVNFSIGVATYCDLLKTKEDILKYSDIAMYESKEKRKFIVTYFNEEIYDRQRKKEKMQDDFVRGIKDDEIIIYVQPKMNLKHNTINTGEALVRWNHKDLGLISPLNFLEIATTLKLISEIDFKVLEKSCILIKELEEYGIEFSVSVNLSLETLAKPSIIHDILTVVKKYNVNPEQITFEILEDKMIQNFYLIQLIITKLKNLGFLFAVDDFGSNFSNFDTLKNLNVDEIKIDKSVTDKILVKDKYSVNIDLLCQLIKQYNCIITIEGVESKEQVEILKNFDIDFIQGYYYSKPLATDELKNMLINLKNN